jgi:hypothetical protein
VLTDNRDVTGELLYYLRDSSLPITGWYRGEAAQSFRDDATFYQLRAGARALRYAEARHDLAAKALSARVLGEQQFPTDAMPVLEGRFYLLKGYKGDHAD